MFNSFSKRASWLTYLGMVPFLICALAIVHGFEQEKTVFILRAYAAVIVSFISGIHWGISMKDTEHQTQWLLISSNIITLLAWASLLMPNAISALLTLSALLILLVCIDSKLYSMRQIDVWFMKLRWRATLCVVISLVASSLMLSP